MNMTLSQFLVSLNYSLCTGQIYISAHSFIALRKSSSLHSYFESMCHYRVSEPSYAYKADYQMQSSADNISKFLSSNQQYQYDQQNNLQNQTQIVLTFLDQN